MKAGNSGVYRGSWKKRYTASYGRRVHGAFLFAQKSGSGPVNHESGGGGFERSGLTPFNSIAAGPGLARIHHVRMKESDGMRDGNGIEQRLTRNQRKQLGGRSGPAVRGWTWCIGTRRGSTPEAGNITWRWGRIGLPNRSAPAGGMVEGSRSKTVVMQSTGACWIPIHGVLEQRGFDVWQVDARDTRNLPGRKLGIQESQWLLKLHTYGLLRKSFRPTPEINHVWRAHCARAKVSSAHRSGACALSWKSLRRLP